MKYVGAAKALLNGRGEADHITKLPYSNMDVLLCCSGYGDPYLRGVNNQVDQESGNTWDDVLDKIKNTFPDPDKAMSVAKKLQNRSASHIITDQHGTDEYWEQVYKALKRKFSKPAAALESVIMIQDAGDEGVPEDIKKIVQKAISLAGSGS